MGHSLCSLSLRLSLTREHNDSFVTKLPSTDPRAAESMKTQKGNKQLEEKRYNGSSKYTTPPVKMIDDRWAGLPV